jgi:hypothetical protein
MTAVVAEPVVDGMPEETYHAHPALSNSGAKKLLSCPAKFKYERDHGQKPRQAFDVGHAFHAAVLGVGAPTAVVQVTAKDGTKSHAEDYRTKSAQEHRDAIRAEGKTPLLAAEADAVAAMVAAVRAHPEAGLLFDPDGGGRPEVSLFWDDWAHDVRRRARLDWLRDAGDGRAVVADLKSCASAEPDTFARSVFSYGYDMQEVFYSDGLRDLGLARDVDFAFVAVEKDPPHVVQVYRLDVSWLRIGRRRVDRALQLFSECSRSGEWPGYAPEAAVLSPPRWVAREWDEDVL